MYFERVIAHRHLSAPATVDRWNFRIPHPKKHVTSPPTFIAASTVIASNGQMRHSIRSTPMNPNRAGG